MNAARTQGGQKRSPIGQPEGNPPRDFVGSADTGHLLVAILQMQKDLGALGEKIDRSCGDIEKLDGKIDKLDEKVGKLTHWQSRILGGAAVLALVVGIVWTVLNLVPWERVSIRAEQVRS